MRQRRFDVRINYDFERTMQLCAASREDGTWIGRQLIRAYCRLHELGFAHSVECWKDGALVGGLYGVSLQGAFFGESMFSRARDASKVALAHLVARLIVGGYRLLDAQFMTEHLSQFGAVEFPRTEYHRKLGYALATQGDFQRAGAGAMAGAAALQVISQAS